MEKRAVVYTRVSDPSQVDNNSLATQEEICKKVGESQGYTVVKVFSEEGFSAKTVYKRPILRELMTFVCKKSNNIDAVIVYKFDRFSRNTEEGLATISLLAKYQVSVISAMEKTDNSPMGTAMRTIMMTLGQLDNELKGERVKDNMQSAFRAGLWPFKCPVGYKREFLTKEENRKMPVLPHPQLSPIITRMFQNAAKGIYSKAQLARIMNTEGFGDFYKVPADHKIVKNILEKSFYYGNMYAPKWKEYAVGLHDNIIDEVTWQKAYNYMILKKKNYKYQDEVQYPLKGTLKCEYCLHPMTTSPSRGRNGIVYYYECKKKGCGRLRINSSIAHEQFEELLVKIQPKERIIKLFQHMVFSEWDKVINQAKEEADKLEKRIYSLRTELQSIRKAMDKGIYTTDEAIEEADRIRQEIRVLEIEKSDVKIDQYDNEIVRDFTQHFLQNLKALWDNLDLAKRQAFLQKVFEGTILCDKNKEIRTVNLAPSFKLIESLVEQNGKFAGRPGFEPE